MEGSPLGLTECGSEDDIESLASPSYGQYSALVKTPVPRDWDHTNAWDASTLSDFMEPLPVDNGLNYALECSNFPQEFDSYIDLNAQPAVLTKHASQRSNMPNPMAPESHTTPATFLPGPANFPFDGVPAQGS